MQALHVVLMLAAGAPPEEGLLLHAPFDRFQVDAAFARGDPKSSFGKSIELRNHPGVKGGALMLEDNERCEYELEGNFNPKRGTLSFWFRPVNWDGDDDQFHHFVCVRDTKTPMNWFIYKYTLPPNLMVYIQRGPAKLKKRVVCGTSMKEWKRGRWRHVAVTWDEREVRLYADGKLSGRQIVPPGFLPDRAEGKLSLAPVRYWRNKWCRADARTQLDEVRVYDRVLSEREVIEQYERLNPYAGDTKREPALLVAMRPSISAGTLTAAVSALHLDAFWARAVDEKASLTVTVAGPKGALATRSAPFARESTVKVDVPVWADGRYVAAAQVAREGRTLTGRASLRKPPTPWLDSKPGQEFLDTVLPPYTALERDGAAVGCWGRRVRFGPGPFPAGVDSAGEALLRGPIVLRGTIDGKAFAATGGTRITSVKPNRVSFEGAEDIGSVTIAWTGYMEFDGMVRSDVTITPRRRVRVERLSVELALRPEFMRHLRTPKRRDWTDGRFEAPFTHYVWVGDEQRGLAWFMESDANFHHKPDTTVVRVDRTTGDASIAIVSDAVATDKTLAYTIGFQTTPLKALPKGWSEWRLAHPGYKHANMMTHGWGPRCYTLGGSLAPCEPDRHVANLKKWHALGLKVYPYTCCGCLADLYDEWPFFEAEWFCAYGSSFPGYKRWPDNAPYTLRSVCVGSSSSDFLVWRLKRNLENGWGDGVYTDIDHFVGCDNRLHGCGYTDAFGRTGKTIPIYRHRDLSKRLYGLCRKHGGRYLSHMHDMFVAPYHAFVDGWCPGEQHSVAVVGKPTFYMDGLTLDDWRATYYTPTMGVPTFMLAQWGRISPKSDRQIRFPTENLVAMAALHNVPLWANFTNREVVEEYWAAQKDFGVADAEFIPYWRDPPVSTTARDVRVSVWRKPGALLAVVVNFCDHDKQVALDLPAGAGACTVILPKAAAANGRTIPVRRKNFTLVRIALSP